MIGVIAHWEDLDTTPYVRHIWKDTVKPLFATHLYFVDVDGTAPKEMDLELTYKSFSTLEDALNEHLDAKFVFLEAERNIPPGINYTYLEDFVHPEDDVFYVFGPDSGKLPLEKLEKDESIVVVNTFYNFAMWAIVVAGIVLYDRKVKWQLHYPQT